MSIIELDTPLFMSQKQAHSSLKGRAGQLGEKFFKMDAPSHSVNAILEPV